MPTPVGQVERPHGPHSREGGGIGAGEGLGLEHAQNGGFPANLVVEVAEQIDTNYK